MLATASAAAALLPLAGAVDSSNLAFFASCSVSLPSVGGVSVPPLAEWFSRGRFRGLLGAAVVVVGAVVNTGAEELSDVVVPAATSSPFFITSAILFLT